MEEPGHRGTSPDIPLSANAYLARPRHRCALQAARWVTGRSDRRVHSPAWRLVANDQPDSTQVMPWPHVNRVSPRDRVRRPGHGGTRSSARCQVWNTSASRSGGGWSPTAPVSSLNTPHRRHGSRHRGSAQSLQRGGRRKHHQLLTRTARSADNHREIDQVGK